MALKELEARYATIRGKDYKLTDGEGLYLFVRANGSKLWRFTMDMGRSIGGQLSMKHGIDLGLGRGLGRQPMGESRRSASRKKWWRAAGLLPIEMMQFPDVR